MNSKIVCSMGIEHYDIIHYLASVAVAMKKSVLIVDLSENGSMMSTVPGHEFTTEVTEYLGIDFSNSKEFLAGHAKEYEYVFVYFGMVVKAIPAWAEEVYVFTDCQKHHIEAFENLSVSEKQYRNLIIRGNVSSKDYKQFALASLKNFSFDEEKVIELPFSESDLMTMLAVQYYSDYRYLGVSNELKEFIIKFFEVDFDERDVLKAIKTITKRKGGV